MCSFYIAMMTNSAFRALFILCRNVCDVSISISGFCCLCVCVCAWAKEYDSIWKHSIRFQFRRWARKKGSDTLHYLVCSMSTASLSLDQCISFRFPRAYTLRIDLRSDSYTPSSVCLVLLSFPIITMKLKLIRTNLQIETDYTQSFFFLLFFLFVPFRISDGMPIRQVLCSSYQFY